MITEISFTYVIKDGAVSQNERLLLEDISDKDITFHEFNKIKLPVSMNPADYGTIRGETLMGDLTRYFIRKGNKVYEMDVSQDKTINKVSIVGASDLNWVDTKLADDLFKRELGKTTIYFLNGEQVLIKRLIPAAPFTRLKQKQKSKK